MLKLDVIEKLINYYHFETIGRWAKWKNAYDKYVFHLWTSYRSSNLYCWVCGEKTETITSKKDPTKTYEICNDRKCNFYYRQGQSFAKIK